MEETDENTHESTDEGQMSKRNMGYGEENGGSEREHSKEDRLHGPEPDEFVLFFEHEKYDAPENGEDAGESSSDIS